MQKYPNKHIFMEFTRRYNFVIFLLMLIACNFHDFSKTLKNLSLANGFFSNWKHILRDFLKISKYFFFVNMHYNFFSTYFSKSMAICKFSHQKFQFCMQKYLGKQIYKEIIENAFFKTYFEDFAKNFKKMLFWHYMASFPHDHHI